MINGWQNIVDAIFFSPIRIAYLQRMKSTQSLIDSSICSNNIGFQFPLTKQLNILILICQTKTKTFNCNPIHLDIWNFLFHFYVPRYIHSSKNIGSFVSSIVIVAPSVWHYKMEYRILARCKFDSDYLMFITSKGQTKCLSVSVTACAFWAHGKFK